MQGTTREYNRHDWKPTEHHIMHGNAMPQLRRVEVNAEKDQLSRALTRGHSLWRANLRADDINVACVAIVCSRRGLFGVNRRRCGAGVKRAPCSCTILLGEA